MSTINFHSLKDCLRDARPGAVSKYITPIALSLLPLSMAMAQSASPAQSAEGEEEPEDWEMLDEVVVAADNDSRRKLRGGAMNSELMTSAELKRAACCNLGESFTTNPSVDVNYSDAATGARQIKLLGLSGQYVQMLTENIPNLRGAAAPYGLSYIPGPWMQSIQVSKGASSVKNGYESTTGQINIEFLKPQSYPSLQLNAYADQFGKVEANASGNIHLGKGWSSGLLLHGENAFASHDMNHDGFVDMPKTSQLTLLNRWAYFSDTYIFQAGGRFLIEKRRSGQISHHVHDNATDEPSPEDTPSHDDPYLINILTRRWEAFAKQAYIFDPDNDGNVALMLSGTFHDQDSRYGLKLYDVEQTNLYASLMYERKWREGLHALSAGLSFNYDNYHQRLRLSHDALLTPARINSHEATPGGYAQYTLNLDSKLIAMAGVRLDHSNLYGTMFTPRCHIRYTPSEYVSLHASAGKGYRSPQPLADFATYLASSRNIVIDENLHQEEAWNFGGGAGGDFRLFDRKSSWSVEYYFTNFLHQTIADIDADPHALLLRDLNGKSYSHSLQAEVTIGILDDLTLTGAYRFNDVRVDYGRGLVLKPLTSRSKGLISIEYAPMMGIWQFDATLNITGGGRLPTPFTLADGRQSWNPEFKTYPTLNIQATRNFRHFSIYIGGENLTNYRQKAPVVGAANPWGPDFDATVVYAPLDGVMAYIGFRYTFTKY